jgi:hypothetical protein
MARRLLVDSRVGVVDPVAELAPLGKVDVQPGEGVDGELGGGAGSHAVDG